MDHDNGETASFVEERPEELDGGRATSEDSSTRERPLRGRGGIMGLGGGRGCHAGSPLSFRCKYCRSWGRRDRYPRNGYFDRVVLTGRRRKFTPGRGDALGTRSDLVSREYRCEDCGHVGWSNHVDLKRKEKRDAKRQD